ncbi:MAG: hypothetical protein R3D98_06795 [Candidatus Krumholzibacteriia bacterium]
MTALRTRLRALRPGRLLGLTALAVVWGVLLLGVAMPSWRTVRTQQAEIEALNTQLADLDRWTVAGLWLEPLVAAREPEVNAEWYRVFPPERAREALFLDVARVADRCDLKAFQLEEIDQTGAFDMGTWSTATAAMGPSDVPAGELPPTGDLMTGGPAEPSIAFHPYTVRGSFEADYARTAAFLGGLARIDRSLDVRRLVIRPARVGVNVELELEVPVSEPVTP